MWIVVNRSDSYKTLPNGVVLHPEEQGTVADEIIEGLSRVDKEYFERLVEQGRLAVEYVPDRTAEQALTAVPVPAETTVGSSPTNGPKKRGRPKVTHIIPPAIR